MVTLCSGVVAGHQQGLISAWPAFVVGGGEGFSSLGP